MIITYHGIAYLVQSEGALLALIFYLTHAEWAGDADQYRLVTA